MQYISCTFTSTAKELIKMNRTEYLNFLNGSHKKRYMDPICREFRLSNTIHCPNDPMSTWPDFLPGIPIHIISIRIHGRILGEPDPPPTQHCRHGRR
jgi:hypothetical protein